jgi:hypothetical protein
MPGPRNERELKRMSRELAGHRKDKDRARRARRLSGAAAAPRPKPRKPDSAPDDWDDEPQEPSEE